MAAKQRLTWSVKKSTSHTRRLPKGSILKLDGVEVARTQCDSMTGKWFWYGGYGPHQQNTANHPVETEIEAKIKATLYVKTSMETEAAKCAE